MTEPLAIARQYQDITEVFRARRIELGLSYEFIDLAGGLAKGHTEAMLGPSAKKGWGQSTFHFLCEILAVEFHAYPDIEAAQRMVDVWEGRRMAQVSENSRISKKLIAKAKPYVLRAHSSLGGLKRGSLLTGKQRIKIAKKAARKSSRLKKLPKEKRHAIALNAITTRWDRVRAARKAIVDAAEHERLLLSLDGNAALAANQVGSSQAA